MITRRSSPPIIQPKPRSIHHDTKEREPIAARGACITVPRLQLGLHSVTASSTPQESLAGCSTKLTYRAAPAKMPEARVATISETTPQYMSDAAKSANTASASGLDS